MIIKNKTYKVGSLLTNASIQATITTFWNDVFIPLNSDTSKHLLILCKVPFEDSSMGNRTLGHLVKANLADKDMFIEYIQKRLGILSDSYQVHPVSSIHFSYIIKDGLIKDDNRELFKDLTERKEKVQIFNNKKIPISMDPKDYGTILSEVKNDEFTRFIINDKDRFYQLDMYND